MATESRRRRKATAATPLSAGRTFVVQLGPPNARGQVAAGRVEHLTSGRAAFFESWRQLQRFVAESVLAEMRERAAIARPSGADGPGKES